MTKPSLHKAKWTNFGPAQHCKGVDDTGGYAASLNVKTTSRRIRPLSAAGFDCIDGGGKYRRLASSSLDRRVMQRSPAASASVFTISELGMNVPRTVFSPTTNTACPLSARTLAASPTTRRMSSMYRTSTASCLARSFGCRFNLERTF